MMNGSDAYFDCRKNCDDIQKLIADKINRTAEWKAFSRFRFPNNRSPDDMEVSEWANYCDVDEFAAAARVMIEIGLEAAQCRCAGDPQSISPLHLAFAAIFIVVGAIGIAGNILTVWVIYSTTSLHSHTNLFLASLAISDLLLILVGVPFDIFHLTHSDIMQLPAFCEITSTSISLFTFASTLTIVSLTCERFVAICYPFSLRSWFDHRMVIRLIYSCWIVALVPSLYIGLQFKLVSSDFCGTKHLTIYGRCNYLEQLPYEMELNAVLTFILPIIFIIYCYVRILQKLDEMQAAVVHLPSERKISRVRSRLISTTSNQSCPPPTPLLQVHVREATTPIPQQAQRMVIKMLVTVTAIFFLCYLPMHLQRFFVSYWGGCKQDSLCAAMHPVTGMLQYVSATLNPILYNVMSVRFRTAFRKQMNEIIQRRKKDFSSIARI